MERSGWKKWRSMPGGRGVVILFFLLLFLYGCLVFRDYGIGVDEPVERRSAAVTSGATTSGTAVLRVPQP